MSKAYDKVIIGAGLYGLYAALQCGRKGERICVLEQDPAPFDRATYINQARVHMGYHYPRSLATAVKSANYFERFVEDYGFCINGDFQQIYATSSKLGWTNANEFARFCQAAGIKCDEVPVSKYFKPGMCDGAFLTQEYTYDAMILKQWFMDEISKIPQVEICFGTKPEEIVQSGDVWRIRTSQGDLLEAPFILNASYASVNILHQMMGFDPYPIKYELCEIILGKPSDALQDVGITVMDGPFFSVMPFGLTGYHSLTSVTFTPHCKSFDTLPIFSCQERADNGCCPEDLQNCNTCNARPETAFPLMSALAGKYLKDEYSIKYEQSLFSMKPIMKSSEVDDSRPTVIKAMSEEPTFLSVLSGKINTIYDLDPYLGI